jgi:hypothetical protein
MVDDYSAENRKETPGWVVAAMVLLAIVSVAGFGLAWRGQTRLQQMNDDYAAQVTTTQQEHTQYNESVSAIQQQLSKANEEATALRSDVDLVTRRLRVAQSDLVKARTEAAKIREESSKELEEMGTAVKTELAAKATAEQFTTVSTDVTNVKTDLETTKNDLRMARSELGTLVARNGDEIAVLRRLGERDYVEFTIDKKKQPKAVGPVTVELRAVDTKRNKFTVALIVDDVRTENKDRLVNEPIFIYPRGSKTQPTEVVINSVGKDKISGYVSIPKTPARTTSASASN